MTNRIGDRPRFPLSNQRFDKGDAENIARYYEEIISRFTGSIYGQAWGFMSNPEFEVVTGSLAGPYIRPKRCVLMYSMPADGTLNAVGADKGPWDATIVQFDPARSGQTVQALYTNVYLPSGRPPLRPWILFRRLETNTATGNKAYWDTTTNTEQIGAAPLQRTEYVEFKLSTTYSSSNDLIAGWHRCAYIDSWGTPSSAETPVIVPIHWMDSQYYLDDAPPVQGTVVASALAFPGFPGALGTFGFNPSTEMPALAKLLHWTIGKLGQHFSTTNTVQVTAPFADTYKVKPGAFVANYTGDGGWLSTPPRGLLELHNDLDTVDQAIIALNNVDISIVQSANLFLSRYSRTTRLLHTLYVTPQGDGSPWEDTTFVVDVCSDTNIDNSFSPNIRALTNPGPALGASDLVYQFTPLTVTGKKTLLTLSVGTSFVLTSVDIKANDYPNLSLVGRELLTTNQNYMTPGSPITLPPGRFLQVQFVIDSGTGEGSDEMRPFTVHIYGRNI